MNPTTCRIGTSLPRWIVGVVIVMTDRDLLLALPDSHPYQAVATGAYRPADVDPSAWAVALPLALHVLAADVLSPLHDPALAAGRRSALCHYLAWLAFHDPSRLTPEIALHDERLRQYFATDPRRRRTSHRSRTAGLSQVRSFRAAFPRLACPSRRVSGAESTLPAQEDWQFDVALRQAAAFQSPATRRFTRAWLLLARGAGLNGADCRWITGDAVVRVPSAGTWVIVTRPGAEREVPVLSRFADGLEDIASPLGSQCLIGQGVPPCDDDVPSSIGSNITRAVRAAGHPTLVISTERLRKAWIAEHLAANTPLNTLLAAAGLKSLRTIESLVAEHSPARPDERTQVAWELGAVERGDRS
jgi:hypothetical protein